MKLTMIETAGISALLGLAFISTVIAAVPADGDRRPAFERGRGPGVHAGRFGHRHGPASARQLERMDTDVDDQISEEEFVDFRLAHLDDLFERLDQNNDGLVSLGENRQPERPHSLNRPELDREEVIACVRETIPDFAPNANMDIGDRFEDADTDGSGSLNLAEVSAAIEEHAHEVFARIDADDAGFITKDELRAHHQAQLAARREVRECIREIVQA